ncbi:MAG: hypothetical protein OM95_02495 [Bdellovibrio sp. ArHS]|uniref:DUF748 domain-containing protein n=1 Tax=Bdellovibrio sp. ArHS TaxID=1569284 RepID=UPI0005828B25|nr:DUF748 domain-containing protein [Bdellovibrio sp. ArHS]KHD89614.1 MAG: hypothetical protein OM95_02495 [Bdellovibrio sp. ArHS]
MKKRTLIILLFLLVAFRIALPYLILYPLNIFLGDFSKVFLIRADDLSLSFLRGAYRLEGIEAKVKDPSFRFLKVEYVDVSLAWRDLLHGNLRTDMVIEGLQLELSNQLMEAVKKNAEQSVKDTQKLGKKVLPIRISSIEIKNSEVSIADVKGLPEELKIKVTQMEGRVSNATATEKDPITLAKIKAVLQDSATMYAVGEVNQWKVPAEWLLSFEVKEFDITSLNPFLTHKLPLSFKSGKMDVYAEVKGADNALQGYAKPFIKNMQAVGNKKDFQGVKHFGIEISGELANLIFSRKSDKTVATRVNFSYEKGTLNLDKAGIVKSALEHGYTKELPTGLENKYQMDRNPKGK